MIDCILWWEGVCILAGHQGSREGSCDSTGRFVNPRSAECELKSAAVSFPLGVSRPDTKDDETIS